MNTVDTRIYEPENWELTSPKDRMFTSDHVLDAFLTGQKTALESGQKLVMEKLVNNLKASSDYATALISKIKAIGVTPTKTFLKINSWDNYSILFIVSEEDFTGGSIDEVYNYIGQFEDEVHSDFYKLDISICDTNEGVDEDFIKSDGFSLKFKM